MFTATGFCAITATFGSHFFSCSNAGSTLVSEPPYSLEISMIDDVPKVVPKPEMPTLPLYFGSNRSFQPFGRSTFFGL